MRSTQRQHAGVIIWRHRLTCTLKGSYLNRLKIFSHRESRELGEGEPAHLTCFRGPRPTLEPHLTCFRGSRPIPDPHLASFRGFQPTPDPHLACFRRFRPITVMARTEGRLAVVRDQLVASSHRRQETGMACDALEVLLHTIPLAFSSPQPSSQEL